MKDKFTEMNIKQKVTMKIRQISKIFSGIKLCRTSHIFFYLIHSNASDNAKRYSTFKYYLPQGFIKTYNIIIKIKSLYGQPIDSDIK